MIDNALQAVDTQARQRALDASGSFIVQAPAGSGKTELLVQRFLVLLSGVREPEEILAITFTRKAAGEMRARILKALHNADAGTPLQSDLEKQTRSLAAAALERDKTRNWNLLCNPGRLRILTIDALCSSLVRQMPWELGAGNVLGIVEDATELYEEAARETLQLIGAGGKWENLLRTFLLHMDNDLAAAEKLIIEMLQRRDQWLGIIPLETSDDSDTRLVLEASLERLVEESLQRLDETTPAYLKAELPSLARYAGEHAPSPDSELALLSALNDFPSSIEELPFIRALASLLLTRDDEWRKPGGLNKNLGFPAEGKTQKKAFQALLDSLVMEEECKAALVEARRLPNPTYDDEQWEILDAIVSVMKASSANLRQVFVRTGKIDFAGVALLALQALGTPEQPTDLALMLDYDISHILIDEFQDTSTTQFRLIELLTAGWSEGDGKTLFLVGDPMQSIYRFRKAEVGLFVRAREQGVGSLHPEPLSLHMNFRSQQALVEEFNALFAPVFSARSNPATGEIAYEPSEASYALDGIESISVHSFEEGSDNEEAETIADLVARALEEHPEGNIGILVRARSHLGSIANVLRMRDISFQAVEMEDLANRQDVLDLLALTKALVQPADRTAWLSVLRAPWAGLTLADLFVIAEAASNATIPSVIMNDALPEGVSDDARNRIERMRGIFRKAQEERGRTTLRRRVEGAWLSLGGPALLDQRGLSDAEVFFDLLDETDSGSEPERLESLHAMLGRLKSAADPQGDARVQIMTIHKSKGLEFDTVIIPELQRSAGRSGKPLLVWDERPSLYSDAVDLLVAPISERRGEEDPLYRFVRKRLKDKDDLETLRVLYVACTRARRTLHLFGQIKPDPKGGYKAPSTGSFLGILWQVMGHRFLDALPETEGRAQRNDVLAPSIREPKPIRRVADDWQAPEPAPSINIAVPFTPFVEEDDEGGVFSFYNPGNELRAAGLPMHEMLALIVEKGPAYWQADKDRLRSTFNVVLARWNPLEDLQRSVSEKCLAALEAMLASEKGKWILSEHAESFTEWELSGVIGGDVRNVRIDRSFVDETGTRWVIDYKVSAHEGGLMDLFVDDLVERNRSQCLRYRALVSRYDSRPVRIGLYMPLQGIWREIPF